MTKTQAIALLSRPTREGVIEVANAFGGTNNRAGRDLFAAALNLSGNGKAARDWAHGVTERYLGRLRAGIDKLEGQRNPHKAGPLRRTLGARTQRMKTKVKLYYSVIIPYTAHGATQWHPTSKDFAPLSRGNFKTTAQAHAWALKHLGSGAKYSLRRYRGA